LKSTLREFTSEDWKSLQQHANNPAIAKFMTNQFPYPYTEQHAKEFIFRISKMQPAQVFAIDHQGECIGAIGIHPQADIMERNAELGYWLSENFWGKGIVSACVKEMLEYGFNQFPINRIYARPFGSNLASQKVLEKSGFKLEARLEKVIFKNGIYEDELIYAVRR
jgi:RimJ/RimL family protein N-acetyltransferase